MAASKKFVKQKENPKERYIGRTENPEKFYHQNPSWNFHTCDKNNWSFSKDTADSCFWNEILPHLQGWETQTWSSILVGAKKQNHSIDITSLNKTAKQILEERYIEYDSIYSLRLTGTHRLYGFIVGPVFNILWFDKDHGDNDTCVCKSKKPHT